MTKRLAKTSRIVVDSEAVACPHCAAQPGELCKTADGRDVIIPHHARLKAALRRLQR